MHIIDNLTPDQQIDFYCYAARAGWCICIFLAGLLGRIAIAWVIRVNGVVSRFERNEAKCEERHNNKRRK